MKKRVYLTAWIIIQFFFTNAYSEVFTVTSKANDGAGSLREALTSAAANGSSLTDYINFNLPDHSEAGRTILITSSLPELSSNLVIDGTTQAGDRFGVSYAFVAIFFNMPQPVQPGLLIKNQRDIEIYGLYLKNLGDDFEVNNAKNWSGIDMFNARNIQIGAANKGNVISEFYLPISTNFPFRNAGQTVYSSCGDLIIKGNFFGLEPDGVTTTLKYYSSVQLYYIYNKIEIGGSLSEGNLFATGLFIRQDNAKDISGDQFNNHYSPADIRIENNLIGIDINQEKSFDRSQGLYLSTVETAGKNNYLIRDNVISSGLLAAVEVGGNNYPVFLKHNYIGTDRTLKKKFPVGDYGISIANSQRVSVGTEDIADMNYITNCKPIEVTGNIHGVTVNRNKFYCIKNLYPMYGASSEAPVAVTVKILNSSSGSISGTATPNSKIELFYADACGTCSPETYFATTMADASGNWNYSGNISGSVIASATYNNSTSEFTRTEINVQNIKINPVCAGSDGSITGVVPANAQSVVWLNEENEIVGTEADLKNVKPGKYKLKASSGTCNSETEFYEVTEAISVYTNAINIINPSCGKATGEISGLNAYNQNPQSTFTYSWKNAAGVEVAKTLLLKNVEAGSYSLTISNSDKTCAKTLGPYVLKNTDGPQINQAQVFITPSKCASNTGSVSGITVNGYGQVKYSWKNDKNIEVATSVNLANQPAGIYTLYVTDNSQCATAISSKITIPEINGIQITSAGTISEAGCASNDGAIKGTTVSGADEYLWYELPGKFIRKTSTPELTNLAPGSYYFIANNTSCSKRSITYTVTRKTGNINYGIIKKTIIAAHCSQNNGSVMVSFPDAATPPLSYKWISKNSGQTVSNEKDVINVKEGIYHLYVTNQNGCEQFITDAVIDRVPEITIKTDKAIVSSDRCNTGSGRISGTEVSGGREINYLWTNESGKVVGRNLNLENVPAGSYILKVSDDYSCARTVTFTIPNETETIITPRVNDVNVCGGGEVSINVLNPSSVYGYRLYATADVSQKSDDNSSGKFKVTANESKTWYISAYKGNCESIRVPVRVSAGGASLKISKAFSPNNDGINDTWKIEGMENYPQARVQIFNRYGQSVMSSLGYTNPFDGLYNGSQIAAGVYYYLIKLSAECAPLSGSLTVLR